MALVWGFVVEDVSGSQCPTLGMGPHRLTNSRAVAEKDGRSLSGSLRPGD